nr:MAG TPA: hypothetical protein [Caudoviricetes sp.]
MNSKPILISSFSITVTPFFERHPYLLHLTHRKLVGIYIALRRVVIAVINNNGKHKVTKDYCRIVILTWMTQKIATTILTTVRQRAVTRYHKHIERTCHPLYVYRLSRFYTLFQLLRLAVPCVKSTITGILHLWYRAFQQTLQIIQ